MKLNTVNVKQLMEAQGGGLRNGDRCAGIRPKQRRPPTFG